MNTVRVVLRFCLRVLIISVAGYSLSCSQNDGQTPAPPIRFAFQNRIGSAIPMVAVEKGYFQQQNLVVQPLRFNSGPACAEALFSGSADIGTMGDSTSILATARHPHLKIIASHSSGAHRHRMVVKDDSAFQTIDDLRGKRIAVKKGTSTHGALLAAMAAQNIPADAITIIDLNPATMPDALWAGSVDAIAASEPTPSLAELNGGRELATFGGLGNQYPILMLAQTSFLKARENDLLAFIKALKKAEAFVRDHPHETIALLSQTTGLPYPVTRSAMQRHTYDLVLNEATLSSLRETAKFLQAHHSIEVLPDFSEIADGRYLKINDKKN